MKGFCIFKLVLRCSRSACCHRVMNQFEAAQVGVLQQLRVALTVGNVNDVDANGLTALHYAAWYGHDDCVKFCIEMGANVNARVNVRNNDGWTPLHVASLKGRVNVVRMLLDAGALVDATNKHGVTPLDRAVRYECVNVMQLLVDRGAKVSNVKLAAVRVLAIPDWVTTFIESRSKCRYASITIIGIHKYHRTTVTGNNDINVLRLIAKHIWSTRMDDVWVTSPIEVETKELEEIDV
jgi:hypothetical protein